MELIYKHFFIFSTALFFVILGGCEQGGTQPEENAPAVTTGKAAAPSRAEAKPEELIVLSRGDILKILPYELRTDEIAERLITWNRESFKWVVLEPMERANAALEGTGIVELIDLRRYTSIPEAETAQLKAEKAAGALMEEAKTIRARLEDKKGTLLKKFDEDAAVKQILQRMPLSRIANYQATSLEMQADMAKHVAETLELFLADLGKDTAENSEELIQHIKGFKERFDKWATFRDSGPFVYSSGGD